MKEKSCHLSTINVWGTNRGSTEYSKKKTKKKKKISVTTKQTEKKYRQMFVSLDLYFNVYVL